MAAEVLKEKKKPRRSGALKRLAFYLPLSLPIFGGSRNATAKNSVATTRVIKRV
ncbi:hypothetical protein EV12_0401 [Prochlorococcus sp. MIT 0701]|nr:hypothetical protein EV12_0401 [Prochlorococcus sp. MIT 0701]